MKALVFHGPRNVSVDEVADPRIEQPLDAVIKITTASRRSLWRRVASGGGAWHRSRPAWEH